MVHCDNTGFLRALLGADLGPCALGALWEPGAVDTCFEAGVGAEFDLRIGGKVGISSGDPVDAHIVVEALSEELVQASRSDQSLGRAARVSSGDVQTPCAPFGHRPSHAECSKTSV